MAQTSHNRLYTTEDQRPLNVKAVHNNLTAAELYERAIMRHEGQVAKGGPLVMLTGQHTGRSASDKFIVRDAASESNVWWNNNKPMPPPSSTCSIAPCWLICADRKYSFKICTREPTWNIAYRCDLADQIAWIGAMMGFAKPISQSA